jgi:undecaprenyl-diphosphatase
MSWNEDLLRFINEDMANPGLDVFFSILIILGTVYVWLVFVPALWWKGKRNEAVDLFFLIMLVLVVTTVLKFLFAAPRPEDIRVVPIPVPVYSGLDVYSFPSNHASRAFACALFLSFRFRKWAVPLFVYAFLIGLAKIYVGAHYPGDIVAGVVVGIVFGFLFVWLVKCGPYVAFRAKLVARAEALLSRDSSMSEYFVGKLLFRELSQNIDEEFLVGRYAVGGVSLTIMGSTDLEVHFDSEKAAELLSLLSNALQTSENRKDEWTRVGNVPYSLCAEDDPSNKDNRGFVEVDARAGKIRLTVHFDPRHGWPEYFDFVAEAAPIRQLVLLIRKAIGTPLESVSQNP